MRIAALFALVAFTACAPKEEEAPPMAAGPTVADFAGTWNMAAVLEGTPDTVMSTLMGAPDGTWTMSLEGRPNIPVTASMMGDSLVTQSAEYESILRPGVMVTVRTAAVMMNGMIHGNMEANYKSASGDQMVKGTITGSKAP
jgi:hypothetical protein